MLKPLLINLGAAHAWGVIRAILSKILILFQQKFYNKRSKIICTRIIESGEEDRISALPDDLLMEILLYLPTKEAVVTMFLSKRWRFVWTMMPYLVYKDYHDNDGEIVVASVGLLERLLNSLTGKTGRKPPWIWRFLELNKAEVLVYVNIQLGRHCPIDVDVGKLITNVINRKVEELVFVLSWNSKPITLPNCFYTCDTLVYLSLYDKIFIDVPYDLACSFPSLESLGLNHVVYKDDESLVRLLSSCPILKFLVVKRHQKDKVKNFVIRVPSLEGLLYEYVEVMEEYLYNGTLVVDSPALKKIFITDYSGNSCCIEDKLPYVDKARIGVHGYPCYKFMRSLASLMYLELSMSFATVAFCNDINFSKLLDCRITLVIHEINWLEPFMRLLQNSPNLKTIFIDQSLIRHEEGFSLSWNEPSSVPRCLSEHLEIFELEGYEGRSIEEKEMLRYIFANSKCLKRAGIYMKSSTRKRIYKMRKHLKSMRRSSKTSQLLFTTQLGYLNIKNEMSDD